MTERELVAAEAAAGTAIVGCLVHFLELQGILKRDEFIAFLQATADHWEKTMPIDKVEGLRVFRSRIERLAQNRESPPLPQ